MEQLYSNKLRLLLSKYFQLIENQQNVNFSFYDDQYQIELFYSEKQILHAFKVPEKIKNYLSLFNQAKKLVNKKHRVDQLYYDLSIIAEEALNKNETTPILSLKEAKKRVSDPFDFLPDISIPPHSYTLFIYEEILLKKENSYQDVWNEYELIKKLDCLDEIYLLCFDRNYFQNPIYLKLVAAGTQFLTEYLEWFHVKTIIDE